MFYSWGLDAVALVDVDVINGDVGVSDCSFKRKFVLAVAVDSERVVDVVPLLAALVAVVLDGAGVATGGDKQELGRGSLG